MMGDKWKANDVSPGADITINPGIPEFDPDRKIFEKLL